MQDATLNYCVPRAKSSGKPGGRANNASDALAEYIARFWSYVDKENGPIHPTLGRCWDWTAGKSPRGYGQFGNAAGIAPGGHNARAHRISYFLDRGAMPATGLQVMHLCHRSSCVRPSHLEAGTAKRNAEDSVAVGHFQRGAYHYAAKLTEAQVIAIRERRVSGERPIDLAAEYGVTSGMISNICTGRKWAHFGGPTVPSMRPDPRAHLTPEIAAEIKFRDQSPAREVAKRLGVSPRTVWAIRAGTSWLGLTPTEARQ